MAAASAEPAGLTPDTTYQQYLDRGDLDGGVHHEKDYHRVDITFGACIVWRNRIKQLHRDGDRPSIVCANGHIEWWKNGKHHRDGDLPAIINFDGYQIIYGYARSSHDLRPCANPQSRTWADGYQMWYNNGQQHRDGDLPAVIVTNGFQSWYKNGQFHRDGNKPSIINLDGTCSWHQHGNFMGNNKEPPPGAVFPGQQTKAARAQARPL